MANFLILFFCYKNNKIIDIVILNDRIIQKLIKIICTLLEIFYSNIILQKKGYSIYLLNNLFKFVSKNKSPFSYSPSSSVLSSSIPSSAAIFGSSTEILAISYLDAGPKDGLNIAAFLRFLTAKAYCFPLC